MIIPVAARAVVGMNTKSYAGETSLAAFGTYLDGSGKEVQRRNLFLRSLRSLAADN